MDMDEILRVDRCRNRIAFSDITGILLRQENPTYRYWAAAVMGGFTMVLFTASSRNNFVGGTCALPNALLLIIIIIIIIITDFIRCKIVQCHKGAESAVTE